MIQKKKRLWALFLSAALVLTQLGATAYAEGTPNGNGGLCEHHAAHDDACGYVEAIPGHDCEHEHTPECYTNELICGLDEDAEQTASGSDAGHTHEQNCYALDCQHKHDTDCGYIEAVPGTPCGNVCNQCGGEPGKDSGTTNGKNPPAPVETAPGTGEPEDAGTITVTAFDELGSGIKVQSLPLGAPESDVTLPATLGASGYPVADDTEPAPEPITITGVTWELIGEKDTPAVYEEGRKKPCNYYFQPVLPDGYRLAGDAVLPRIEVRYGWGNRNATGAALNVEFNSNGTGGTGMNDNDMKTAIDAAIASSRANQANIITIKFTGSATEITGYNWRYLKELYNSNNGWDSLTALNLSGMTNLEAIRQDTRDSMGQATKLTTLTLPDSVTEIGEWAFNGCTNLKLNELPGSLTQIGEIAFNGCTGITLKELPGGVEQIGAYAFSGCTGLDNLTIPASVERIGDYAFDGCTNLKKVTFEGKTAPSFGTDVFGLSQPTVYVPEGATGCPDSLNVQTGILTVIFDSNGTGGSNKNVNEMKTAIETALTGNDKATITTIKLTGGATEITDYNWRYLIDRYYQNSKWDSLTTLDLSGMTRLKAIRNDTNTATNFQIKLKTLTLPDNITEIGSYVFYECMNLTLQTLPDGVTKIGDGAFEGCKGITLAELPDGVTQIGKNAFRNCKGITLAELPSGVTQIGHSAFYDCKNITLNALPAGLTEIGAYTFDGCTGITLTELPGGVTEIGFYAFDGCTGITLTELPSSVTKIWDGAFDGCTGLDKIIMEPTTAPTLGTGAFSDTRPDLILYVPKNGTGYNRGGWEYLNTVEYTPVTSISLPATLELQPNGSDTLTVTFTPGNATFKEIIWESSDAGIATVDQDGNVTAGSNGTATITATSRQGKKTATCAVTVKEAPPVTIPVTGVMLNHSAYTLHTDKDPRSFQLTATVEPADASNKAVSWQSSDTNIATVDASGTVTAIANGTATITVTTTDGSKTATCTVTVKTDSSGNSSGSGGGGGDNRNHTITTPQPPKPNNPALAVIELPVTVEDGTATGKPDDGRTAAAITEAGNRDGAKQNGIAVQYDAKTSTAYDGFSIVIQRATLERLIENKVKYVTLNTGIVDLTFDLAALKEIAANSTGDITLTATRETGLAGDALAAVGKRPAYRLSVGYTGADGKAATVDSFGAGRVTVGLAYVPTADEQAGSLCLVYSADGKGAQWLYSSYKRTSGNVIASVGHFSVYAVGHRPAPAFTDTVNHWAKPDIDFVASRGLLTGTGETTFSPDSAITRGMFVTALGRLAGVDPAAYPSSSRYTDVAATACYAPYVEWAVSKGIVTGTGETAFSPDATITREQMAAIMQRYADKLGYTLPVAREAEIFADEGQITSGMKNAVQVMQQAGVMNGKGDHRFGPKDTATRAEAAAVLRRFAEVVIDRATAGGWGQNDAGRWLYYEDAKPVTGWKQIDGIWYYFDGAGLMQAGGWLEIGGKLYYFYPDGAMAVNTRIDGYETGPDGARKEV